MSDDTVETVRNVPTPEGRLLGEQLARLTEVELAARKAQFPNHAEPCGSCAFRRGTYPNGCAVTVMDALKCVVEQHPFMCHEHRKGEPMAPCTGWFLATTAAMRAGVPDSMRAMTAPWEYSK